MTNTNPPYDHMRLIESGSFGYLIKAHSGNQMVMINQVSFFNFEDLEVALNQKAVFEQLDHPNVLKYCEISETKEDLVKFARMWSNLHKEDEAKESEGDCEKFFLRAIVQFHPITLHNELNGNFDSLSADAFERWMISIWRDGAKGLSYLHEKDIFHGNLNIDTIVFSSDKTLKICHYGFSKSTSSTEMIPDPQTSDETKTQKYKRKLDVYDLGLIFIKIQNPRMNGSELQLMKDGDFQAVIKFEKYHEFLMTIVSKDWSMRPKACHIAVACELIFKTLS